MNSLKRLFKKNKKTIRAFIGWLGGALIQVSIVGPDVMATWTKERWILGIAVAALPGFVGLIGVGEVNPTDEEMYEKVRAVKQAKKEAAGVETTGELPLPPAPVLPKP